jgi:hypothetical protein
MIKPIKFDLKLNNGEMLRTLDDLKNNLSPELFEHFHSGKLAKWLRVRKLEEEAEKIEELLIFQKEHEAQLFKKLGETLGIDFDENEVCEVLRSYDQQNSQIEQLKDENFCLQLKIQKYESCYKELTKTSEDLLKIFNRKKSIPAVILLMKVDSIRDLENKMKSKLRELKSILEKIVNLTD